MSCPPVDVEEDTVCMYIHSQKPSLFFMRHRGRGADNPRESNLPANICYWNMPIRIRTRPTLVCRCTILQ